MCSIRILLFFILVEAFKCKEAMLNESVKDFLMESRSRLNNWNKLLPKLKEIMPSKFNRSWTNFDSPFWLRMANQALYLQYLQEKKEKKSMLKFELAKKIPFIKKITNQCLTDPWSNMDSCKFEMLSKNIQLLCLIENLDSYQIENFFKLVNSTNSEVYSKFCWIVYAIHYLEQCQINMLIDEDHCGLNNVELIIKLIIKKFSLVQHSGIHEPFDSFYSKAFKDRAMQTLTQILILLNNLKIGASINRLAMESEKLYEYKFNLERLLNHLLNEYAHDKVKFDFKFKIADKQEKFKIISKIIDLKISDLINLSVKMVLKNLAKHVKVLDSDF